MIAETKTYATLFQLTGVGVVGTDMATGRLVRANRTFSDMVGYSEAELKGMTNAELTHPDDWGRDAESFAALQRGELAEVHALTRCIRKDGETVWLELHVTLIREGDEAINIAVVNDVTERKRTEGARRASEEKYRTLFNSIDEGFCIMEVLFEGDKPVDYRFLEVNPAFEKQTGLHDAVGRRMLELAPEHERYWFDIYGEVVLTGEPARFENRAEALDHWYDVYAFRVGEPRECRVAALFTDITERKVAAAERERLLEAVQDLNHTLEQRVEERTEELKHSEQRFSQAFYSNPIPACMTTFGHETFVEVNNAFLTLTGYKHDEIVGKSSHALAMWSSPEDLKKLNEAQRYARGFHNLELKLQTKEGEVRDILISAEVIRLDDHDGYLKMFYDITERKRTEEQLHQAIGEVMSNTSWFSHRIMEQLAHIKTGGTEVLVPVELSKREREVLERLAGGVGNAAIAAELGLSPQTIRNYITTVYDKLGVHSRAEAVVWARERGIVGP